MDIIGGTNDAPWTLEAADRYCERLAQTHYENFTVGWVMKILLSGNGLPGNPLPVVGLSRTAPQLMSLVR
jgi:hypothetical protein